jgi:glycerol-3-phosphate dehydrogenase
VSRLDPLTARRFDLLVVGGGIHGVFAAWDAALRGLDVALVERGDFGGAASGNSLKILHGGIRYLRRLDVARLRESSAERATLMRLAPHLVRQLPCVMPTSGGLSGGRLALRSALAAYDALAVPDPDGVLRGTRLISDAEYVAMAGPFASQHAGGAALWYDALLESPDRLLISIVGAAARAGAALINYAEATELLREGASVAGARVRGEDGEDIVVRARLVLLATNAGARALGVDDVSPVGWVRASNVVVRRQPPRAAVAFRALDRSRWLFAVPWRGHLMLGTTQRAGRGDEWERDARELIEAANLAAPALALTLDDVSVVHRGILAGTPATLLDRAVIIDHGTRDGLSGLVTMLGPKWTTARRTAERAVVHCARLLGAGETARDVTSVAALFDAVPERDHAPALPPRLTTLYGPDVAHLWGLVRERPALGTRLGGSETIGAQIVHAARREGARHLDDVVLRRTELGAADQPGREAIAHAARLMAEEHGWDAARTKDEIERVATGYPRAHDGSGVARSLPDDAAFRARQLELFGVSVLKQAKWRALAEAVGDTTGLDAADLGSDNGVISWLLRQRGGRWTSADLTEETVESIGRMIGEPAHRLDGPSLPFPDGSLDVVVVVDLLEHLEDDAALLTEIARVLRPGGRAVLNVPRHGAGRLLPAVRHALGLTDAWHGHVHAGYDDARLRDMLPPSLRLASVREYSRSFSHALDTALNWMHVRRSRGRAIATAKGVVVTGGSLDARGARLLRRAYPLMRAFVAMDALLPLARGYMMLATLERTEERTARERRPQTAAAGHR